MQHLEPWRLRYVRLKLGFPIRHAAKVVPMAQEVWKNWELGRTAVPAALLPHLFDVYPDLLNPNARSEYAALLGALPEALPEHLAFPTMSQQTQANTLVSPSTSELRFARENLGQNQTQAAQTADVAETVWWAWESGLRKVPSKKWESVRGLFGVPPATGGVVAKVEAEEQAPAPRKPLVGPTPQELRVARGDWSLAHAAMLAEVQPGTWARWEAGTPPIPVKRWLLFNAGKNQPGGVMEKIRANLVVGAEREFALPERVKMHREVAGLTREEAGAVVGVTARAWQAWELGNRNMPQPLLDKFAGILSGRLNADGTEKIKRPAEVGRTPMPNPVPWTLPKLSAEMPPLPGLAYVAPTEEQERIMEESLATPMDMSPSEVREALQTLKEEQEALKSQAAAKLSAGEA